MSKCIIKVTNEPYISYETFIHRLFVILFYEISGNRDGWLSVVNARFVIAFYLCMPKNSITTWGLY